MDPAQLNPRFPPPPPPSSSSSSSSSVPPPTSNSSSSSSPSSLISPPVSQIPFSTPVLKVMRLYSPPLSLPPPTLSLPSSFGVIHAGSTFTAYLGVLNPSSHLPVKGMQVTVKLLTPTGRHDLLTKTTDNPEAAGAADKPPSSQLPVDVPPLSSVDMIVSKALDSPGLHTLRVTVTHGNPVTHGNQQTLRKFYKFTVDVPVTVTTVVGRLDDCSAVVAVSARNNTEEGVTVSRARFEAREGLVAVRVRGGCEEEQGEERDEEKLKGMTGAELFDAADRLDSLSTNRYMYIVRCSSPSAKAQGLATGDSLGRASFSWTQSMCSPSKLTSLPITVPPPPSSPSSHRTGLTVTASAAVAKEGFSAEPKVTVEAIDPPARIAINVPTKVTLLVKNHAARDVDAVVSFRARSMNGVVISGPSSLPAGVLKPGGAAHVTFSVLGLVAGLCVVAGCVVSDGGGREGEGRKLGPLFSVFVERGAGREGNGSLMVEEEEGGEGGEEVDGAR